MKTEDILERETELRAMREALAAYIVVFEFERIVVHDGLPTKISSSPSGPGADGPFESQ